MLEHKEIASGNIEDKFLEKDQFARQQLLCGEDVFKSCFYCMAMSVGYDMHCRPWVPLSRRKGNRQF